MSGFLSERALPHLVQKLSDAKNIKTNEGTLEKRVEKTVNRCEEFLGGSTQEVVTKNFPSKVGEGVDVDASNSSIDCFSQNFQLKGNTRHKRRDGTLINSWEEGVELESVGQAEKNLITIRTCGENLFDLNCLKGGEIVKFNGKNCYKFTDDSQNWSLEIGFKENTQYFLSYKFYREKEDEGLKTACFVHYTDGTKDEIPNVPSGNETFKKVTKKNKTVRKITGSHWWGKTAYLDLDYMQLLESDEWEHSEIKPFKGEVKKVQLPHPFRKVGNVADEIYEKNGKVWLEKNIDEIVLNGSENWVQYPNKVGNTVGFYFEVSSKFKRRHTYFEVLSNNFDGSEHYLFPGKLTKPGNRICLDGSTQMYIKISIDEEKLNGQVNPQGFKKWLSKNPTTVLFQLESPTIVELKALPSLRLFKNGYIFFDNIVQPYEVKYLLSVDKPAQIDSSIRQTQALENKLEEMEIMYDNLLLNSVKKISNLRLKEKTNKGVE